MEGLLLTKVIWTSHLLSNDPNLNDDYEIICLHSYNARKMFGCEAYSAMHKWRRKHRFRRMCVMTFKVFNSLSKRSIGYSNYSLQQVMPGSEVFLVRTICLCLFPMFVTF